MSDAVDSSDGTILGEGGKERDIDGDFAARVFEGGEEVSGKISEALLKHIDLARFSVFVSPCRCVVTAQWGISGVFPGAWKMFQK